MKFFTVLALALVLVLATSAYGLEKKAVQMKEDYGTEPLYDTYMHYYYYIPCPTSSWFWNFTGWAAGDMIGVFYTIGDPSMGRAQATCPPYLTSDPFNGHTIQQFRVLDFAGYGTVYPGLFTTEFNIWCSDERGCPVGPALWNSGPVEFCAAGWNIVPINGGQGICVTKCYTQVVGGAKCYPRVLITATMTGTTHTYPAWGLDNISTPLGLACVMHDTGCCPALYPRPINSHYSTMHSGYYGVNFQYCPPAWIINPGDSTGDVFGYLEWAWRIYVINSGPTATEPSTWGKIKTMYK